jgi:hypothetical protein
VLTISIPNTFRSIYFIVSYSTPLVGVDGLSDIKQHHFLVHIPSFIRNPIIIISYYISLLRHVDSFVLITNVVSQYHFYHIIWLSFFCFPLII